MAIAVMPRGSRERAGGDKTGVWVGSAGVAGGQSLLWTHVSSLYVSYEKVTDK
jgi:hypothetical protein